MEDSSTLGGRIRSARIEAGLTQQDLAKMLGVTFQSLQQWECNESSPRLRRLALISKVLNTTQIWLITGEDNSEASTIRSQKIAMNIGRNLLAIFNDNGINASRFCELCLAHDIVIAKSTISRIMTGSNVSISTLSEIVCGIHACFPHLIGITESILLCDSEQISTPEHPDTVTDRTIGLIESLQSLGWIKVNQNREIIVDFIRLMNKHGDNKSSL